MRVPSNRVAVLSITCAIMLLTAGCTTTPISEPSTDTTAVTESSTPDRRTTTSTVEQTGTTNRKKTTTKGVFGSIEHELQIKNYLTKEETIRVQIESANGTVVFEENITVEANSSKEIDFTFPYPGEYVISANVSFANETRTWNVKQRDPTVAASIVLIDGDELHISIEAI